ncbi:transposase [Patescibacteria group bacterium]|nr:transposase [Patescibacteria group bacterium]
MPGRDTPLVTDEIYHIFNKGVAGQKVFRNQSDYERAQDSLFYYKHIIPPVKYSRLSSLHKDDRKDLLKQLEKTRKNLVDLIAYCLMPNHFHLLAKQLVDGGISRYLSNFCNSYTRYFNTKRERTGPLFQGKFKAVLITSNEQLLHVSRYIHLNPYSSSVVKSITQLKNYPYSSLTKLSTSKVESKLILDQFKSINEYYQFVFDQADYQKNLEVIKKALLE